MVARHLTLPHRFVCFCDDPAAVPDGIETLPMAVPHWRWNLRKMALYRPDNGLTGRVLALDLDTVIVGNIDDIANYGGRFAVVEDFWRPGKNGGGIIGFEAGTLAADLYDPVAENSLNVTIATKGAERLWYDIRMPGADHWQDLYPGQVASYKPSPGRFLTKLPRKTRIVCFHGKPAVHEVNTDWVLENWK